VIPPLATPFSPRPGGSGPLDLVPLLAARLSRGGVSIDVVGRVDSGASFSVLPLDVGRRFGVPWASLPLHLAIGGAAGSVPARVLTVSGVIGPFPAVALHFAWANTNAVPLAFGQANFFYEFDVCVFRRRGEFHIQPATP
jgi:hypothetical protein